RVAADRAPAARSPRRLDWDSRRRSRRYCRSRRAPGRRRRPSGSRPAPRRSAWHRRRYTPENRSRPGSWPTRPADFPDCRTTRYRPASGGAPADAPDDGRPVAPPPLRSRGGRRSSPPGPACSCEAILEVRVLLHDLVATEREDVAGVDLDLLALGSSAGEPPLPQPTIAGDEMARLAEIRVREHLEDLCEGLAHALAALVARAADFLARGRLEHAVVGHEGHDEVDVVAIPAVAERFQIFDRHHAISPLEARAVPNHPSARATLDSLDRRNAPASTRARRTATAARSRDWPEARRLRWPPSGPTHPARPSPTLSRPAPDRPD